MRAGSDGLIGAALLLEEVVTAIERGQKQKGVSLGQTIHSFISLGTPLPANLDRSAFGMKSKGLYELTSAMD